MIYVLVVEDEEDIRNLLVEQMEDKGCEVRKANNGLVALQRVREQTPDIIFVDVNMPVMDGFLFISELQEDPETFQIPVVLVTAISVPELKVRAEALGVKHILTKPWQQPELDTVIEQALAMLDSEWKIPAA